MEKNKINLFKLFLPVLFFLTICLLTLHIDSKTDKSQIPDFECRGKFADYVSAEGRFMCDGENKVDVYTVAVIPIAGVISIIMMGLIRVTKPVKKKEVNK